MYIDLDLAFGAIVRQHPFQPKTLLQPAQRLSHCVTQLKQKIVWFACNATDCTSDTKMGTNGKCHVNYKQIMKNANFHIYSNTHQSSSTEKIDTVAAPAHSSTHKMALNFPFNGWMGGVIALTFARKFGVEKIIGTNDGTKRNEFTFRSLFVISHKKPIQWTCFGM